MRLYLIRHGKTAANEQRLYCGSTDLPLSETGKRELEMKSMCGIENVRFVTSGMLRTKQTLQLLFGEVPFEVDERFREMDFGVFEMGSYETLKERTDYQIWISGDNEVNICPGGESGVQMKQRVLEGLADLLFCGRDTVLVAHGGTIAIMMEALFPDENKNRYEWQPKPGCGYLIENDTSERQSGLTRNDTLKWLKIL